MSSKKQLTDADSRTTDPVRVAATHVDLVKHGDTAAQFYLDKPGLFGPPTAVDIYHCIADLAAQVKELRAALEARP
jgi:hypothetical protein